MLEYSIQTPEFQELLDFLKRSDVEFDSPLSAKVDLEEYAAKLWEHSTVVTCRDNGVIIGFVVLFYIFNCIFKCTVSCGTACNNGHFFARGEMLVNQILSVSNPSLGAKHKYFVDFIVNEEFFYGVNNNGF